MSGIVESLGKFSEWVPVALKTGGSVLTAISQRRAGAAQQGAAEFQARQMDVNAGQSKAAAQRQAQEERRRSRFAASRALALASAGGSGVTDPTVTGIIADISGEGAYRSMVAVYEGEERARQYRMGAAGARYQGAQARYAGNTLAVGSLIKGAGSIAADLEQSRERKTILTKYGGKGPPGGGFYEDYLD